jgi:nicotinate-nucleotide adenylyltransferase
VAARIGVFGGTFDPVHLGHMVAAVNVRHALQLDEVLFVVANVPWQKVAGRTVTPAEDRMAMVEAALQGRPGLVPSRIELDRGGDSYMADTLEALAAERPGDELYFIAGSDVADALGTWERTDVVQRLATLVVVNRPGVAVPRLGEGWRVATVEIPNLEISSTDLRARAADGRPLDFLVPAPAVQLIKERGLYARGR